MSYILQLLPAVWQPIASAVFNVWFAFVALSFALLVLVKGLLAVPRLASNKPLLIAEHWLSAFTTWIPQSWLPASLQTPAKPVLAGSNAIQGPPKGYVNALLLCGLALVLGALCSCGTVGAVSWSEPVFYAGPAVAAEMSLKGGTPGAAGCQAETLGFGQFVLSGHEFDAVEAGLLECGGIVVPSGGASGQLQLGGKIGTLDGMLWGGLLFDCVDSTGQGACQGGKPPGGGILAGGIDVQALIAYFGTASASDKLSETAHPPRGGLSW